MNLTQLLFSFDGRIRRTNYWLASPGAGFALMFVLTIVFFIMGGGAMLASQSTDSAGQVAGGGLAIVGMILYLAIAVLGTWIGLALQVKRWHDRDKAWPWIFINFIPFVGVFWVLIECGFVDGTQGP